MQKRITKNTNQNSTKIKQIKYYNIIDFDCAPVVTVIALRHFYLPVSEQMEAENLNYS